MLPDWPPWTPQDFMATRKVEAGLSGLVVGLLLWPILGPIVAAVGAVIVASGYVMFWGVRAFRSWPRNAASVSSSVSPTPSISSPS